MPFPFQLLPLWLLIPTALVGLILPAVLPYRTPGAAPRRWVVVAGCLLLLAAGPAFVLALHQFLS
ncbi:MAG TPA: hypothetical protein VF690_13020 [Hymenobacter sp.]|jgi:hypothetical protein